MEQNSNEGEVKEFIEKVSVEPTKDEELIDEMETETPSSSSDEEKEPEREVFKIKVLVLVSFTIANFQGDERHPLNIKVQLSSDHDIFFLFETVLNEDQYKILQVSQGLHAEFSDFPQMLVKMLNNVTRPGTR